jgi:hypothetical protein
MGMRLLAAATAVEASAEVRALLLGGAVGDGAAHQYLEWASKLDLPDPEEILADPRSFKIPRRGDRAHAALVSVVAVVAANPSIERWASAWDVVSVYVAADRHDIAAVGAKGLVRCRPEGAPLSDAIAELLPILEEAGLA